MNTKKKLYPILAVIVVLALAALACGGGAAPTQAPQPTDKPPATDAPKPTVVPKATEAPKATDAPTEAVTAGELAVVNSYGYVDSFDYVHIVGELLNDSSKPVADIELTIEVRDKDGKTLLKGDDGNPTDSVTTSPFLYTVGPGEYTPFDYYFDPDGAEADEFTVTITGQETGDINRVDLNVENTQMVSDDSGNLYITGELVNASDVNAKVNNIAAAALDQDQNVVAANGYGAMSYILAPAGDDSGNDRTPFRIRLDDPGSDVVNDYVIYIFDADEADSFDAYDVDVEILTGYFDSFDSFHLIGTVTNNSDTLLNIGLVAGLYADDNTVLDADTLSTAIYVAPGETVPWDFQYFSNVNGNRDQADLIDSYTVQVDPYWTYETSYEVVALETTNDDNSDQGDGQWKFMGDVVNSSGKELSSMTVLITIWDKDDNIVGMTSTYISPEGDSFKDGDKGSFETYLYLDPNADSSEYTFTSIAQGYVK